MLLKKLLNMKTCLGNVSEKKTGGREKVPGVARAGTVQVFRESVHGAFPKEPAVPVVVEPFGRGVARENCRKGPAGGVEAETAAEGAGGRA